MDNSPDPSKENLTSASRFPLVHKLIEFADIRRKYTEMRKALITSNRQAGASKGWITRWKNKYNKANLDIKRLEVEKEQLWLDNKDLTGQIQGLTEEYQGMSKILVKIEKFENAVDQLRDLKLVVDEQVASQGHWSSNSMLDMQRGVDNFLEAADEILNEDLKDSHQSSELS